MPTTQLERGWVNVNALSIIDLQKRSLYATLLLDRVTAGAADPWGVALTPDGTTAFVTLSGVHEVARLDLARLHKYLAGQPDRELKYDAYSGSADHVWDQVRKEPERRVELLSHHLSALYGAGLMTRHRLPVEGPRGVDVSPDGTLVAVVGYFSGSVLLFAPDSPESNRILQLGPVPQIDSVRRGEMLFHDGRACFQGWLTCASCHAEGRVDGLNWDLQNDGVGNPKNARSMMHAAITPPSMSLGVRADFKEATTAGFRFILFHEPTQNEAEDVQSYIASLRPERSPYLVKGSEGEMCLSAAAQRGKELFESPTVGCARCHSGTLSTDLRSHDVGTHDPRDRNGKYDTPALTELWRTVPYLHDGRAASLLDVLTVHNADDKHGITSHLTSDQLDDLAHYLLSL